MNQEASQIKRIAEKMKMLAGSLRIAADVVESVSRSIRDVADLLDKETFSYDFRTPQIYYLRKYKVRMIILYVLQGEVYLYAYI